MKKLAMILAVVGMVLAGAGNAPADVWSVDPGGGGDFTTIQAAIDGASSGDTINVATGTYAENLVIPQDKTYLQLIGAGSDVTTISTSGNTTLLTVYAPAIVKGFHFTGPDRTQGNALFTQGDTGAGDRCSGTSANPGLFENNKVSNIKWGMKSGDWDIEYWQFKGNIYDNVYIPIGLENMSNVEVSGNKFSLYKEGVYGDGDNVAVKFNWFLGSDHAGSELAAIRLSHSEASNWDVYGNYITDSICGVSVGTGNGSLTNVSVSCNNIVGNTMGVENEDSDLTLLAEGNWWGDATGPTHSANSGGLGDPASDYVDYNPWLSGPCPNAVPEPATLSLLALGGVAALLRRRRK